MNMKQITPPSRSKPVACNEYDAEKAAADIAELEAALGCATKALKACFYSGYLEESSGLQATVQWALNAVTPLLAKTEARQ